MCLYIRYICIHTFIYVCVSFALSLYICMYVSMYVHIYVYIYMYIHIYIDVENLKFSCATHINQGGKWFMVEYLGEYPGPFGDTTGWCAAPNNLKLFETLRGLVKWFC